MTAVGVSFTGGTTAQLFAAVSQGTTLKFYTEQSTITDLPSSNGVIEIVKGPSDANQRYGIFNGSDGTVWHYKYHAGNTSFNGWNRILQNADIQAGLTNITPTGENSTTEFTISIPRAMSSTPAIFLTAVTGDPDSRRLSVKPNSVSNTGFTVILKSIYPSAVSCYWVAIAR